jgi:flagellar assembly factor FliW
VKVDTKTGGIIDVDDRQKIVIPHGLFGFEGYTNYVLLDAEQEPFYWLQSIDEKKIAFILIDPFIFRRDYEISVADDDLADLGIQSPDQALVFSIVTIPSEGPITANLQGPLIINRETKIGKQAILNDSRWKIKHDIMAELAGSRT